MTGTLAFLRMFLRRDRWMLLWWGLGATLLYYSQAVSVDSLYDTQADFDKAAASMQGNAALIAMAGPARALNTVGGQVTWQASAFGAVVAGLMSMFIIGRHTRAEEESGRDELVRATAVGRFAPMAAALLTAMLANVLLGALVAVSLISYPLATADSIALGVGLTLCGWVFTGTAMVAAQLTASSRSMYGIAGAVLGAAYVLRAVGDVGNPVFRWLSPIGWYQAMHPFSGLRWLPALLIVVAAALMVSTAYVVFARRDVGSGVFAARPGPAHAGRDLRSGLGLSWRLQRGAVIGWAAGLFLVGLAYGSMGNDVGALVGDSQAAREMFLQGGGDLTDAFYATSMLMLAVLAAGFSISSAMRPRGEEDRGHAEFLLATALSRRGWLTGQTTVTVVGSAAVLAAGGIGLGLGYALVTGDWGALLRLSLPMLQYVAPLLVLSGVVRVLFGLAPRLMVASWSLLVLVLVVMLFGQLFQMPQWAQDLSPFEHLALVPAADFALGPFVVLGVLALLLSVAGQVAFSRRDVG
ncbi:polyketide antibiotic transporter [Nocardioides sp.]|uniref:ABC transporter permease n=1 Tax=Nocardioides sp. TaxID=35761 RepID=UPI0031FE8BCF|nr:putative transporter [Nocardioides sp.]